MNQWILWGFTGFFIGMALLDIVFKLRHTRRRGTVRWRLGTTLYNHLIAGVLLGWLIFVFYQAGGLPVNLPFVIAVLVFGLLGAIPPLTVREHGVSNAYFRLGWEEIKDITWDGNKLLLTPKNKLFHPTRHCWRIPEERVEELQGLLEFIATNTQDHRKPGSE